MTYQTSSEEHGIKDFSSMAEATAAAKADPSIWKISYSRNGERVRIIKVARDGKDVWEHAPVLSDS